MNLAYHVPVPTHSGAARKHELREAARVVEAAAHGVVRQRRRLAADRGRMLHTHIRNPLPSIPQAIQMHDQSTAMQTQHCSQPKA